MIRTATFLKSIVEADDLLEEKFPHIAFIGRSNVGKSSTINALTGVKNLARTSSFPGLTRQINLYLINKSHYFLDLPGYGFAKASRDTKQQLEDLISWYLFDSHYHQKAVVLIIDAEVGMTALDREILGLLEKLKKPIIIAANKIDKIKPSRLQAQLKKIDAQAGTHRLVPYSTVKKTGLELLTKTILS